MLLALIVAAPAIADDWLTVTAGNFEVYTNAGAARATQAAEVLERMRAGLAAASALDTKLSQPVRVYLFRTKEDYRHYGSILAGDVPGKDGMSIIHHEGRAILVDGSVKRVDELLQHELAHHFVRQTLGDVPVWLDEGLAELYALTKITPGFVEIGRRRRRTRGQPVPPAELLTADRQSRWYNDPIFSDRFYASAWLLVNWLTLTRERDIERLTGELARSPADQAVSKVLGMTSPQLQRTLQRYNTLPALPTRVVKIGALETAPVSEPRPVTDAERRTLFTWTAPKATTPAPLVVKQMVIVLADPKHVARYDDAVKKIARGELAGGLEILEALIPDLPPGELLEVAKKLRGEVTEIMRKNRGGAR